MRWLVSLWAWLSRQVARLRRGTKSVPEPRRVTVQRLADMPDQPQDQVLYILGEDGYDWLAAMKCPGGCGKVLEMNLYPDAKPVWNAVEEPDGTASLYPSVWLKTGCKCHYVVRSGRIIWT